MKDDRLGEIQRLDLRDLWNHEERDFTPWLRNSIQRLGEALGLDITIDERERPVGKYSADLVGKLGNTNRVVVIENQLEETDHTHLGQVLTYASGLDAGIVVWIAKRFCDEHRSALDWLNGISSIDVSFFGVELDLMSIDGSRPALDFKPVVIPSEWEKTRALSTLSPRQRQYHEFFTKFLKLMRESYSGWTTARRGQPQNWCSLGSGYGSYYYQVVFTHDSKLRTELCIDSGGRDENEEFIDHLLSKQDKIEERYGGKLSWEKPEKAQVCRVADYLEGTIDETQRWEEFLSWAVENMGKLRETFTPYIKEWEEE